MLALLVTALAAAAVHLTALAGQLPPLAASLTKPIPVVCLALAVISREGSPYARRLTLGLGLSALGDVVIDVPVLFLAGLGLFLLAHLATAWGLLSEARQAAWPRALPAAALVAGALALLAPRLGWMAIPVALYALALGAALWRALAAVGVPGRPALARWLAVGGLLLFAGSDLALGMGRFLGTPVAGGALSVMVLYWAGQAGIAGSVLAADRREAAAA